MSRESLNYFFSSVVKTYCFTSICLIPYPLHEERKNNLESTRFSIEHDDEYVSLGKQWYLSCQVDARRASDAV